MCINGGRRRTKNSVTSDLLVPQQQIKQYDRSYEILWSLKSLDANKQGPESTKFQSLKCNSKTNYLVQANPEAQVEDLTRCMAEKGQSLFQADAAALMFDKFRFFGRHKNTKN